ncbi:hypothetical protein M0802_016620 [Mischocyttarus mexicanus]|nr:hypothetical protein M0802_016620 [Mischocyttarus mexicanus]
MFRQDATRCISRAKSLNVKYFGWVYNSIGYNVVYYLFLSSAVYEVFKNKDFASSRDSIQVLFGGLGRIHLSPPEVYLCQASIQLLRVL